jgi:hypothetical protein
VRSKWRVKGSMSSGRSRKAGSDIWKPFDTVQQVRSERAVFDDARRIAVRRGDDAHIDLHFAHSAHTVERARLDCAQEFRLQRCRQLRYFVQEERAAVREFKESELASLAPENAPAS